MKRFVVCIGATLAMTFVLPAVVFAHVVVTPNQANVGQTVLFSMSVPNERDSSVTTIKLDIPSGLTDVKPTVQAGWTITTEGGDNITSITWTGTIPVGQRADFTFEAQAPAQTGELDWKAHQTYGDGTVVNWDQKPAADEKDDDAATSGPYSVTKIANDLTGTTSKASSNNNSTKTSFALVLSIAALALSVITFVQKRRK